MKKAILFLLLIFGATSYMKAEVEKIFELYEASDSTIMGSFYYEIDRAALKFRFDSDSEDEAKMLIKNYKKSGTKESFDLYPEVTPTKKRCSVVIQQNAAGKNVMTINDASVNYKRSYVVGTEAERKALYAKKKGKSTDSTSAKESATDKAKKKAKSLLKKGTDLFK